MLFIPKEGPYTTKRGLPKITQSFVCYADILGYSHLSKQAIKSGNGIHFLTDLRASLTVAYERIRKTSENSGIQFFSVKVFTDNIVVGYPLNEPLVNLGEPELGDIFQIFGEYQAFLASRGFFIRGGIAFGDHYMDDDIVFGDALLEAVSLDKEGGPPRLVLAPSVTDIVKKHLGFYGNLEYAPQYSDLLKDADGNLFVNYMDNAFVLFPDGPIIFELIEAHRDSIIQGLSDYRASPGVRAKYEWVARYHNFVCRDFMDRHPVPHHEYADEERAAACQEAQKLTNYLIDIESMAAEPGRIDS